jgi:hypothetical protein
MFKALFSLFLSIIALTSFGQLNVSPNILSAPFQGQHFSVKAENDVEGSPFLFDSWKRASIIMKDGNSFLVPKINFDASRSFFVFNHNDTLYDLGDNVSSVKIYADDITNKDKTEMTFIDNPTGVPGSFVQVLTNGKITILRKFIKRPEGENFSNGIVKSSREYVLHSEDFTFINKKLTPIKYNSSSLEELVADKKSEINSYVKSNNLKPKKQSDFLKTIEYYNSLN